VVGWERALGEIMKLIYTLVESLEDAQKIARILVEEKLVACVNIFPSVQSVYEWNGALTQSPETAMIIKVADPKYDATLKRLEALHPYETPAIITVQPHHVNAKFLDFVQ
jgi:periplasmic divalent cation tolerance protein